MKVQREHLRSVMKRVAPMVKNRTTLPVLSCVLISGKEGRFSATATDLDSFVEASCDCEGSLEAMCVAPGPLLALSEFGPDTMDLSVSETRLKVVCGATSRLSTLSWGEFPMWPNDGLKDLGVNPHDLADAIESVAWAADPKSLVSIKHQSVWVHLVTKHKKLVACAVDGRKLAYFSKAAVVPDCDLMFLAIHASLICEALRGTNAALKVSPNWVNATNDHFRSAVKQVDGKFLPVEAILKQETKDIGVIQKGPITERR